MSARSSPQPCRNPARNGGRALGVAGTPTSLAAIAQHLDPYDPTRVHGYRLTATQRDQIFRTLAVMPLEQRRHVPGLHPDRAIAILPGIVILTEVMNLFGLERVRGLRARHPARRGADVFRLSSPRTRAPGMTPSRISVANSCRPRRSI